jgi:uncharacterized membrane protein YgcG
MTGPVTVGVVEWIVLVVLVVLIIGGVFWWRRESGARKVRELGDARAEAQRWYERLGGQVMNLYGEEPAVRQALADAGERYTAAGSQLEQARTARQYELARETALEGLAYVRAARTALGIDPGPELPPLAAARGAGQLTKERAVDVNGEVFRAGPQPGRDTPYYYPGGRYQGRPVPAGWYSQPWWKPALAGAAGAIGGLLIMDALFSPAFADPGYGYGGFDQGYQDGFQDGAQYDDGGDGGQVGDSGMGSADGGGYDGGGGDWGGGGDFGGGDFGGGDF